MEYLDLAGWLALLSYDLEVSVSKVGLRYMCADVKAPVLPRPSDSNRSHPDSRRFAER